MRYVDHARERLAERGISEHDIELALRRPEGPPEPGSGIGNMVTVGAATGGKRLKVVCSAADRELVVSAWWLP